jgi:hypothetical protein
LNFENSNKEVEAFEKKTFYEKIVFVETAFG